MAHGGRGRLDMLSGRAKKDYARDEQAVAEAPELGPESATAESNDAVEELEEALVAM